MEPPLRAGRLAGRPLRAPSLPQPGWPWPLAPGSRRAGLYTSPPPPPLPPGCKCTGASLSPSS
eukprot:9641137-Alexandrium_andersonii.AAC.1